MIPTLFSLISTSTIRDQPIMHIILPIILCCITQKVHLLCLYCNCMLNVGLRELCSKSSSLFYSKFPQKLYHYAHYYSQNLLIILIILNFTAILYSFSSLLQSKCATMLCSGLYYIKFICNSLLQ